MTHPRDMVPDRSRLPARHLIYDGDGRPENIRTVIGWTVLVLVAGFFAVNAVTPNNDTNIAFGILYSVMSITASACYGGKSLRAIWRGSSQHIDYLIVAICGGWFCRSLEEALRVVARLAHFDPAFVNSEIFGLLKLAGVVFAVLHILPRGAADGVVPRGDVRLVASAFAVAAVLAVTVLAVRPDPAPFIRAMPWWSKDLFQTNGVPPPDPPPRPSASPSTPLPAPFPFGSP